MGNNQSSSSHHHRGDSAGGGHRSRSSSLLDPSSSSTSGPLASTSASSAASSSRASSSSKQMIDGGFVEPQSLLYSHVEYHRETVHKLIVARRLSPFYLGLNDFEPEWSIDEIVDALDEAQTQATTNLKDAYDAAVESVTQHEANQLSAPAGTRKHKDATVALSFEIARKERLRDMLKQREKRGGGGLEWTNKRDQAKLYQRQALECPICFLYYPPNMVHTRCCDQPICTECFVQIKRAEPTPTHLESEPAACPFCMEPNFGCVYDKPTPSRPVIVQPTHSGASSSSSNSASPPSPTAGQDGASPRTEPEQQVAAPKPRRKSFAHTEKEVVTTDMLHPDWETKLEAMKATVARRANRRIVFRQVGDRLIPVGITSGRTGSSSTASDGSAMLAAIAGGGGASGAQTLPADFLSQIAAALDHSNQQQQQQQQNEGGGRSGFRVRTGRRRGGSSSTNAAQQQQQDDEVARLLEQLGLGGGSGVGGPDLEEMMLQEAMRLSQLEEEERLKKVKDEEDDAARKKQQQEDQSRPSGGGGGATSGRSETRDDDDDDERGVVGATTSRRTSTERALTEAMSTSTSTVAIASGSGSSSTSAAAALERVVDQKTPSSPTKTLTFPASPSSGAPNATSSLPIIDDMSRLPPPPPTTTTTTSTSEFDPLGPSVSRASTTTTMSSAFSDNVVASSPGHAGYQQLEDDDDGNNDDALAVSSPSSTTTTTSGGRTGGGAGPLIDI